MSDKYLFMSSVDWNAVESEFRRLYGPNWLTAYPSLIDREMKASSMENKITEWAVRNQAGSCLSWHSNKAEATKAAEKYAAQGPGQKFFVCRVEPITMSVTNNVTTKEL